MQSNIPLSVRINNFRNFMTSLISYSPVNDTTKKRYQASFCLIYAITSLDGICDFNQTVTSFFFKIKRNKKLF